MLDVARCQLVVLRQPQVDPAGTYGYDYASKLTLRSGDSIAPLFRPTLSLPVDQVVQPRLPSAP